MRALLFNRSHFKPHLSVKDITYINYKGLKNYGINYIIFDKDNTLTLPYERELYDPIRPSLNECIEVFG